VAIVDLPQSAETHRVFNQPPPLDAYHLYDADVALREAVVREGAAEFKSVIAAHGERFGQLFRQGFQANENKPVFHSHDRFGHRLDLVEFHPAYHELMDAAISAGQHSLPWTTNSRGAHVARAAMGYMQGQVESGFGCPLTMTFAAIPTIRHQADVAEHWEPLITSRHYDPRNVPASQKRGVTIGMAMTEKQGGSDVRANTTEADCIGREGGGGDYELVGHKWFCSAPMCDAFLLLAHVPEGLSCFLLPRWRPDDSKNAFYIQRLKNKVGNWSNASSEVEFRGAYAQMIGEPGRGVATIIEMVSMTRLDCMIGSAALMRQAVAQATHHCNYREAFGKRLIDQPLMQAVLADLVLENEAALTLAMRVGRALDHADTDPHERDLARIATAIGKFWICKRTPPQVNEAMECLGGVGYVEESILPRLYREAPLNSIWEGSGNVQCLDVLRALARQPGTLEALLAEIDIAAGNDKELDRQIDELKNEFTDRQNIELRARRIVEQCAVLLQVSLLIRSDVSGPAEAFLQNRIRNRSGIYGRPLDSETARKLIDRALPQ